MVFDGGVKGKVVVVVGASSGMGRATSLALAAAGATVVACARRAEALSALAAEARGSQGAIEPVVMDVRDRASVEAGLEGAASRFGRMDALIYAAGINIPGRAIGVLTPQDWENLIATNLTGAFHCTQAALPIMSRQEDGLIVYISSISAKRGDMSGVAYQAAKRGIDGLVAGAATELEGGSVRFTVIYPGLCDTPLIDNRPKPPTPEERAAALKPEDIAALCLYVVGTPPHVHVAEVVIKPKAPLR